MVVSTSTKARPLRCAASISAFTWLSKFSHLPFLRIWYMMIARIFRYLLERKNGEGRASPSHTVNSSMGCENDDEDWLLVVVSRCTTPPDQHDSVTFVSLYIIIIIMFLRWVFLLSPLLYILRVTHFQRSAELSNITLDGLLWDTRRKRSEHS